MNYQLAPHIAAEINGTDYGPGGLESLDPRIAGMLDHRPSCHRARLILLVRITDQAPVLRCSNCNQYLILRGRWVFDVLDQAGYHVGPEDVTQVSSRVRSRPVPVVSRYWCREHADQPVDHRGRGCPECRQ